MSDVGRYRLVYPRLWRHPGFQAQTKSARELALYLLTGPQTNRIGLFYFSVGTAAEDLNVSVETLRKGLADVSATFGWTFDAKAKVVFIPSWWKWNPPANANVLKGNLKDLNEIPPCALVDAFARNLETLPQTLHETFVEGCTQRMREPSPTQYQEQKHLSGAGAIPRAPREKAAEKGTHKANGSPKPDETLMMIAKEAVRFTSKSSTVDELVDAFQFIARGKGLEHVRRPDAVAAMNAAMNL